MEYHWHQRHLNVYLYGKGQSRLHWVSHLLSEEHKRECYHFDVKTAHAH